MNELEKALFAVDLVKSLLGIDRKILAVKFTKMLYGSSLKDAKRFTDMIQLKLTLTEQDHG